MFRSTSLYVFMIAWNDYLFALLFLVEDRDHWTVPLGLALLSGSIEIPTTVLTAGLDRDGVPPQRPGGGRYFFHRRPREVHPAARDESAQDGLLDACAEITGVSLP